MCERCEELEERVAWLEGELGIQRDLEACARLRAAMLRHRYPGSKNSGRLQSVGLVAALHAARGRPMTRFQLMEAIPPAGGALEDERNPKIIDVWVCFARRALGKDVIETIWGRGYRLTAAGMAKVAEIIGEEPAPDALMQRPQQVAQVVANG